VSKLPKQKMSNRTLIDHQSVFLIPHVWYSFIPNNQQWLKNRKDKGIMGWVPEQEQFIPD